MRTRLLVLGCLLAALLLQSGCWQRVAIARGVKKVESGDGPVGQMVNQLADGTTDTSGAKTTATTSDDTSSGAY